MSDDPYKTITIGNGVIQFGPVENGDVVSIASVVNDDFTKTAWLDGWIYNPTTGEEIHIDLRDYANGDPNKW